MKRSVVYHAGCPDGFGAAWAAWRAWGDEARYVARGHDDAFDPEVYAGATVVFADISLENRRLRALGEAAAHVVVLDHHLTARAHFHSDPQLAADLEADGHRVSFDLEHSGAMLAWAYFHPEEPAPDLLLYVEDQDLWNWKLPRSEEVNAAIGSHPREFATWNGLAARSAESLADEGAPISRANRLNVERALTTTHPVALGPRRIEATNALSSRAAIGHELAKRARYGPSWGLVYRIQADRVDCSIYSTGDLDVSAVAAEHGGGGHKNASGFSVSLREWLDSFV